MANPGQLFIYIGTYATEGAALADYQRVRELKGVGAIGSYDAAVVTRDADGKVHVTRAEMAARHAGWGGALAGALVGMLFPPAIIGTAIVGGAVGVVSGHLWRGLSRSDLKEFGETIDAGEVALVVAGENKLEPTLDIGGFTAGTYVLKNVDLNLGDIDEAVLEATRSER